NSRRTLIARSAHRVLPRRNRPARRVAASPTFSSGPVASCRARHPFSLFPHSVPACDRLAVLLSAIFGSRDGGPWTLASRDLVVIRVDVVVFAHSLNLRNAPTPPMGASNWSFSTKRIRALV